MDVLIFLVKKDRVWFRKGVNSFQNGVKRQRAFRAMEKEDSLWRFDQLWFSRLEYTGGARVLRFPIM